jgi:hypothetical protein
MRIRAWRTFLAALFAETTAALRRWLGGFALGARPAPAGEGEQADDYEHSGAGLWDIREAEADAVALGVRQGEAPRFCSECGCGAKESTAADAAGEAD